MKLRFSLSCIVAASALFPAGPSQQCADDAGPPVSDDIPGRPYHAGSPARAVLSSSGVCPTPLKAACSTKDAKASYLEGPIDCGGKGWFCRILDQDNWNNPFYDDKNFEHCNVPNADEQDQGGHCHGSDADDVYGWWVRDHWHRGYAGTLHCCCDWEGVKGLVNRCDYRKHVEPSALATCRDANEEHNKGFEDGCAAHASKPYADPVGTDQCWTVRSFAHPESVQPLQVIGGGDEQPTSQPTNQPTKQPTNRPTDQPTSHPTNQPTNQPTNGGSDGNGMIGFNWGEGCAAGEGRFVMNLEEEKQIIDVGEIPVGKWNVEVYLEATGDIDIQLYDLDDDSVFSGGKAVVAYCEGSTCNAGTLGGNPTVESVTYDRLGALNAMAIEYSGYNGDGFNLGKEYIKIAGETSARLGMRVFAYAKGQSRVYYKWGHSQEACCAGLAACEGSFSTPVDDGAVLDVGKIPAGKIDIYIRLRARTGDIDVQLFDLQDTGGHAEGKAIIAYCNTVEDPACNLGLMSGPSEESYSYEGVRYFYSGYNGIGGSVGHEGVWMSGLSNRDLMMKVFGFTRGEATVTYSYWNPPRSSARSSARISTRKEGRSRSRRSARSTRTRNTALNLAPPPPQRTQTKRDRT